MTGCRYTNIIIVLYVMLCVCVVTYTGVPARRGCGERREEGGGGVEAGVCGNVHF